MFLWCIINDSQLQIQEIESMTIILQQFMTIIKLSITSIKSLLAFSKLKQIQTILIEQIKQTLNYFWYFL